MPLPLSAAEKLQLPTTDDVAAVLAVQDTAPQLSARGHQVVSIYLGRDGPTMAEVAQALGISADGVKKHLVSVRRKFQDSDEPLSKIALRQRLVAGGWLQDG
ncbi:hypothetical protein [Arthrobacter sp. ISL-95]|uniref:hypothetical protein n=1 Tax=Arthrobacter sp. ISL-95 TaxID=2819116 RepID=UPI001BE7D691|nr:hypothetical protein [Arthrobacter sp. ISL-95]MBT2586553.1 hypothetical protein [Arthrobacter sp. ISL-95]